MADDGEVGSGGVGSCCIGDDESSVEGNECRGGVRWEWVSTTTSCRIRTTREYSELICLHVTGCSVQVGDDEV